MADLCCCPATGIVVEVSSFPECPRRMPKTSKSMWTTIEPLEITAKPRTRSVRTSMKQHQNRYHNGPPDPPATFQHAGPRLTQTPTTSRQIYARATRGSQYGGSGAAPTSGEGGIRTPDAGITDITVFETAAFNRSATSPRRSIPPLPTPSNRHNAQILLHHTSPAKSPVLTIFVTLQLKFRVTSGVTLVPQAVSPPHRKSLILQVLSERRKSGVNRR